jgi:hypothetical protein
MICDRRLKHYLSLSTMDEMAFLLDKMIGAFEEILEPFGARIFGFWQRFGEGAGSLQPVTEPKRSQNPKRPLPGSFPPNGYSISENAPVLGWKKLLSLLRSETPRFFELAEVVGKQVWIQFGHEQPSEVTAVLAEFGFH